MHGLLHQHSSDATGRATQGKAPKISEIEQTNKISQIVGHDKDMSAAPQEIIDNDKHKHFRIYA